MLAAVTGESASQANIPLLEFDDVSFDAADESRLLTDVSLRVSAGAITVVRGPSGAGKSTLLRLGNRLDIPSAGAVRLRGADLAGCDAREIRRRVGMVLQRPTPFAGSVWSNLSVARPTGSEAEFREVLARVGLPELSLDRTADELSGGEAQRMCLARTLLTEPEVLLMDEPTSALDFENRRAIEALARDLVEDGIGVVWVSHDLDQVNRIADNVEVLINGRNASEGAAVRYLERRLPRAES